LQAVLRQQCQREALHAKSDAAGVGMGTIGGADIKELAKVILVVVDRKKRGGARAREHGHHNIKRLALCL
jgi:hypothetical protein